MTYRAHIVDDEGTLLGTVVLDGYDLRLPMAGVTLVGEIADQMGNTHLAACAARTTSEEDDESDATER